VGRTCGTHGRGDKICRVLVGKSEGKKLLGRPRRGWEDGSEWILGRLAGGGVMELIQLRTGTGGGLL
jgi:hypothetical protein